MAKKILEQNPNVNIVNNNTALMLEIKNRKEDLAEKILLLSVNLDIINISGETALMLAIKNRKEDLAKKILEKMSKNK